MVAQNRSLSEKKNKKKNRYMPSPYLWSNPVTSGRQSSSRPKASTILQFIDGWRGDLPVSFEEGTWALGLYDLLSRACRE